jgi:hypothetical protein
VLRRFTLLSVLAFAGALFAAAPTLAQSVLKPSSPVKLPARLVPTPSPEEVEFGPVDVHGSGARQTVRFANTFPKPAEERIHSVEIVGKQASSFQIVSDGCSGTTLYMSPDSCAVEVAFDPGKPIDAAATLELVTVGEEGEEGEEEPGEEVEVPLSGEGIIGTLSSSRSSFSFSAIPYIGSSSRGEGGQNETEEITIRDSADASAQIESVSITGPDAASFSVQWQNCERNLLSPNNTCTMGIRFEPASLGANDAQLEIANDSSNSPLIIPPEGEGLNGPKISFSSRQALLGEVLIGSSTWQTFTLTNSGDYPLGIQQAFLVSGTPLMFPILSDGCSGQIVKPGATCALTVGFQPTTTGEKDASILLITSSSLPVEVLGVDGVGVQPAVLAPQAASQLAATSLSVTFTSPQAPVVQVGAPSSPPHRAAKPAHSRCKRRKACQKEAQQRLAAARHRQRISAVRLRQRR